MVFQTQLGLSPWWTQPEARDGPKQASRSLGLGDSQRQLLESKLLLGQRPVELARFLLGLDPLDPPGGRVHS